MNGYLNQRWPSWFQPRLVNFDQTPFGPFASHHSLTQSEDVHLVPTPGHSPGHLALILEEGDQAILFAGDASYTQDLLIARQPDGIGDDPQMQQDTHIRILAYAEQQPTVYLPSHDPGSQERLENRTTVKMNRKLEV